MGVGWGHLRNWKLAVRGLPPPRSSHSVLHESTWPLGVFHAAVNREMALCLI